MKKFRGIFALVMIVGLMFVTPTLAWNGQGGHHFWSSSGVAINGKTCTGNLQVWDQPAQMMAVRTQIGDGAVNWIYAYNRTNYTLTNRIVGPFFGYNTCYAGYDITQNP